MNLLAKDKYRTKIMEHLLHQSSTQEFSSNPCYKPQIFQQNHQNAPSFDQVFTKSAIFDKVSKQKPLISDGQATQRQRQVSFNKQKSADFIRLKENLQENLQNKSNFNDPYKFATQKANKLIPEMKIKGHLKKQSIIFHQKLPIMQVPNLEGNEILKKLKKNIKSKDFNQDKQNISGNFNSIGNSDREKEKKYRFIVQNKVIEALNLRKPARKSQDEQTEKQSNKCEVKTGTSFNTNSFNQTQRSKGSKQMIEFLQSAREKLFENMNKTATQNDTVSKKQPIKENNKKSETNLSEQIESYSFKIEIQVSSNKTIEVLLNLNSDPNKVARDFIEQNKGELSSYHGLQFQKLEGLLSNKISVQVSKQRRLFEIRREKEFHKKYMNIIDHVGVNEVLLKSVSSGKKTEKKRSQRKDIKKSKKNKLQFSHVYVENIETLMENQEYPFSIKRNERLNQQDQNLNQNRMDTLNGQGDHYLSKVTESREVTLGGYLNSPHELITYRADSPSFSKENQKQSFKDIYMEEPVNISHFPLTKEITQNTNHSLVKSKNPENQSSSSNPISQKSTMEQIGAAKILSKSRSKLAKKQQLQDSQNHLYKTQIQPQRQRQQNQQQNYQLPDQLNLQNNKKQETDFKPYPQINSISSKIVAKLGKQNILNSVKEKQLTKRQKILKERQEKITQQLKQCSFKPKINNLSKSIDQNKKKKVKIVDLLQNDLQNQHSRKQQNFQSQNEQNQQNQNCSFDKILSKLQQPQKRYEELYQNYKTIQTKKQIIRRKSIEQIKFTPQLNQISKKIMETKRSSLNNSICQEYNSLANSKKSTNRHQSACKKSNKRNSVQFYNQAYNNENQGSKQLMKKRKSLNMSRNVQGLEIGDYLYKQAMKMKKKKEAQQKTKIQNFKPLDKSQKITLNLRHNRLSQYFDQLLELQQRNEANDENQDFVLSPSSFDLSDEKFLHSPLRYLVPLLQQLKDLQVSLTREEFIESGMKLINFLSQDEKVELLKMRKKFNGEVQQIQAEPCLNKLSLQLIEMKEDYVHDIYQRGVQYKKQIKQKIEYDMQDKVRRQLEKCTFKPKIKPLNYRFSK